MINPQVQGVADVLRRYLSDIMSEFQITALALEVTQAAINRAPVKRGSQPDEWIALKDEIASTPMLDAYSAERRDHWARRMAEIIRRHSTGEVR